MNDERGSLLQRHLLLVQALCDERTSKGDCQVLAVIASHADKGGEAWPGLNRIACMAGIHRTTVATSTKNLESWGYVIVARRKGIANRYLIGTTSSADATSTSSADTTSPDSGPVASTHASSSVEATTPVVPTLPDQSRSRDPNSALELSFSNSEKRTQLPEPLISDEQKQERQQQDLEQAILASERKRAESLESIRDEYLAASRTHPQHAAKMARMFPGPLSDLLLEHAA